MDRFGKNCTRCGAYFVEQSLSVRLCPWCQDIEAGNRRRGIYVDPEDIETLEL